MLDVLEISEGGKMKGKGRKRETQDNWLFGAVGFIWIYKVDTPKDLRWYEDRTDLRLSLWMCSSRRR